MLQYLENLSVIFQFMWIDISAMLRSIRMSSLTEICHVSQKLLKEFEWKNIEIIITINFTPLITTNLTISRKRIGYFSIFLDRNLRLVALYTHAKFEQNLTCTSKVIKGQRLPGLRKTY